MKPLQTISVIAAGTFALSCSDPPSRVAHSWEMDYSDQGRFSTALDGVRRLVVTLQEDGYQIEATEISSAFVDSSRLGRLTSLRISGSEGDGLDIKVSVEFSDWMRPDEPEIRISLEALVSMGDDIIPASWVHRTKQITMIAAPESPDGRQ